MRVSVTVNESLVRETLVKTNPADLDSVLSVIQAYRMCIAAAHKLRGRRYGRNQGQLLECAEYCERALTEYATTGALRLLEYPTAGAASVFHLTIYPSGRK